MIQTPPLPRNIAAIIELGHQFGHRIVAEVVETRQAYALLRAWGCDAAQGYWIARSMPAGEAVARATAWQAEGPGLS